MSEPHHPFSTHLDLVMGEHRQRAILLGLGVNVDKGLQLCTAEQGAVLPQHPVEKLACVGMAKGKDQGPRWGELGSETGGASLDVQGPSP